MPPDGNIREIARPIGVGTFRIDTLRDVLLHVITETASHAGHAGTARELIDGERWMVPTE